MATCAALARASSIIAIFAVAVALTSALPTPAAAEFYPRILAMQVLEDPDGSLEFADALASRQWEPASRHGASMGYSRSVFWYRLAIQSRLAGDAVLSVRPTYLDDLRFYVPQSIAAGHTSDPGPSGYALYRQGDLLPLSAREYPVRGFAVPLAMNQGQASMIIVRLETTSTGLFIPRVQSASEFAAGVALESYLSGMALALVVAIAAFALVQLMLTGDRVYLTATALALAVGLFFTARDGDLSLLLPNAPALADRLVGVSVCAAMGGLLLFVARTLDIRTDFPNHVPLIRMLAWIIGSSVIVAMLGHYNAIAGVLGVVVAASIFYLLGLSIASRAGSLAMRAGRIAALAAYVPTVLLNLGAIESYRMSEALLHMSAIGTLMILVFILWDESSRKLARHEAALTEARDARIEAQIRARQIAVQRQWMTILSHEIKTPLAIIDSSRTNIARIAGSPDVLERTTKIGRGVESIDKLVGAILASEELEERMGRARSDSIDLRLLVDACVVQSGDQNIVVDCSGDLDVQADPGLIAIAISNLITNARTHGDPETPIGLSAARQADGTIEIAVVSSGDPIESELRNRLFEKHARASGSKGHGIGLWAVASIASLHGGSTGYAHRAPRQNRFHFRLGADR